MKVHKDDDDRNPNNDSAPNAGATVVSGKRPSAAVSQDAAVTAETAITSDPPAPEPSIDRTAETAAVASDARGALSGPASLSAESLEADLEITGPA